MSDTLCRINNSHYSIYESKSYKFFWLVAAFVFAFSAADARPIIKIGIIAPLTGPSAAIGEEMIRTLNLLADNLKAEHGKLLYQFIFEDGKAAVDSSESLSSSIHFSI